MIGIPLEVELSNQVIFDHVVEHFKEQKVRAIDLHNDTEICMYRGPNNTSCAVGCCLTDEEYKPVMEGWSVDVLEHECMLPARFSPHSGLLHTLQGVHDGSEIGLMSTEVSNKLKDVAMQYSLSDSKVDW